MTDGRGLARDPSGRDATPELRVSDRDRDQVVEILQVAAGDGRLTAVELDERLDAALSARTTGDLARLTADLPLDGMPRKPKTWSGSTSVSAMSHAAAAGWFPAAWKSG